MSNLNFSKGKFSRFLSSKGFYVAIAVCLVGAGAATWLAVDRTITGIENNNHQLIESENQWNEYPRAEDAETKQEGVLQPPARESSQPESSSSSASSSSRPSVPVSEPVEPAEPSVQLESLPTLAYALPISNEIITPFSNGELVKNVTLNDWRTHDGIDIQADQGAEVLAVADGTVSDIRSDPLWGTVLTIDHIDGNQSVYCGLDKVVPVKVGDAVMVKQVVGKVDGVPCEINQSNHLHLAIKNDGKWVDPLKVIQGSKE